MIFQSNIQVDGGFPCPSLTDEEQEECAMPECPYTEWGDWGRCAGEYCGSDSKGNSYRGSRSRARDCIPAVSTRRKCVHFKQHCCKGDESNINRRMMVSSLVVRQLMKRERNAICLNAPTLSISIVNSIVVSTLKS